MKLHGQDLTGDDSDKSAVQKKYWIEIEGDMDQDWSDWFGGMSIGTRIREDGNVTTILYGPIPDQAALRGILSRLWDINTTLVSVSTYENDEI